MAIYEAIKCPCGHWACNSWMVNPVAAVQGVSFTKQQAEDVAALLNNKETQTMNKYTVVVLYPRLLQKMHEVFTYTALVEAESPTEAMKIARREAMMVQPNEDRCTLEQWLPVVTFEGHLKPIFSY